MRDDHLLDGASIRTALVAQAREIVDRSHVTPRVCVLGVDHEDPRAALNVGLHRRFFERVGFAVDEHLLPPTTTEADLLDAVDAANRDAAVDVVMVLLPLPAGVDIRRVLARIDADKEIEGLHVEHASKNLPLSLAEGERVTPVVPEAVLHLLASRPGGLDLAEVVVLTDPELTARNPVSRAITGLGTLAALPPTAMVTVVPVTHPQARETCARADVLLVSVETPLRVTAAWVKPGAVVIDFNAIVNTHEHPASPPGPVVGGVDAPDAARRAGLVAGIPGGFGPVLLGTVARRIAAHAARRRAGLVPVG